MKSVHERIDAFPFTSTPPRATGQPACRRHWAGRGRSPAAGALVPARTRAGLTGYVARLFMQAQGIDEATLASWGGKVIALPAIERQYRHLAPHRSPLSYPLSPPAMARTTIPLHAAARRYYERAGYLAAGA